jgi:hypothetical protein
MIFEWFDAKTAKDFGESLARFYVQRLPLDTKATQQEFGSRTAEVLKMMESQVLQFKRQNKLNMYKTAQMGNAFKWALKDAGYDDAYVDRLTEWLVINIKI